MGLESVQGKIYFCKCVSARQRLYLLGRCPGWWEKSREARLGVEVQAMAGRGWGPSLRWWLGLYRAWPEHFLPTGEPPLTSGNGASPAAPIAAPTALLQSPVEPRSQSTWSQNVLGESPSRACDPWCLRLRSAMPSLPEELEGDR